VSSSSRTTSIDGDESINTSMSNRGVAAPAASSYTSYLNGGASNTSALSGFNAASKGVSGSWF
jgi:hypothetical protein